MKVNLLSYVAYRVPRKSYRLLRKNGYFKIPKNRRAIAKHLAHFVNADKEKALLAIARIHPDRNLIIKSLENEETFSFNEENLNYVPSLKPSEKKGLSERNINLLIVGGSIIFATSLITLIVTAKK